MKNLFSNWIESKVQISIRHYSNYTATNRKVCLAVCFHFAMPDTCRHLPRQTVGSAHVCVPVSRSEGGTVPDMDLFTGLSFFSFSIFSQIKGTSNRIKQGQKILMGLALLTSQAGRQRLACGGSHVCLTHGLFLQMNPFLLMGFVDDLNLVPPGRVQVQTASD